MLLTKGKARKEKSFSMLKDSLYEEPNEEKTATALSSRNKNYDKNVDIF